MLNFQVQLVIKVNMFPFLHFSIRTNLTALRAVGARGQRQPPNGATGADAGGNDVLVKLCGLLGGELDVVRVDVDLVLIGGLVPVPALDHGVHEVLEGLVGLLIPSNSTDAEVRCVEPSLGGVSGSVGEWNRGNEMVRWCMVANGRSRLEGMIE